MKSALLWIVMLTISSSFADSGPVTNFHIVSPGVWRSARPPSLAALQTLADQGLKTILDLENDPGAIAQESQWAKQLKLNFISEQMDSFQPVNTNEINEDLSILQDDSGFAVLVHCSAGRDRTGLIIGLYRVLVQRWTPRAAYQEMLADGFHSDWSDLDSYFKQRTGWNGSPAPLTDEVFESLNPLN